MTKRDFEVVADVLAASTVTANLTEIQREDLAASFAREYTRTHERFDAHRFYAHAIGRELEQEDVERLRYEGVLA